MTSPNLNVAIVIEKLLFDALEAASTYGGDLGFCKLHFEATMLHELVHWARFKSGVLPEIWTEPPTDGMPEAGSVFETWAYDRNFCQRPDVDKLKGVLVNRTIQLAIPKVWVPGPNIPKLK